MDNESGCIVYGTFLEPRHVHDYIASLVVVDETPITTNH